MAWGMFTIIPCPRKKWNENARPQMLAMFPLVGLIIGAVWAGVYLLVSGSAGTGIAAALLCIVPWVLTGFMHLDGFMDVCDAVLSRRGPEERRRILKDPHCGAFSVICLVILALLQWSACLSMENAAPDPLTILCIPVTVRACAALAVMKLKPMQTSQYAAMNGQKNDVTAGGTAAGKTTASGEKAGKTDTFGDRTVPVLIAALFLLGAAVLPVIRCGSFAALVAAVSYWTAAFCAYRNLEGMNGDISGFALTVAELAGIMAVMI